MSESNQNIDDSKVVPESSSSAVPENDPKTVPENSSKETQKDDSHPGSKKGLKFSYFEPVAGIIFSVVAAIVFLGFPIVFTVVYIGGPTIPTFIAEFFPDWDLWIIIPGIIWALLRIGVEVAYLVERRYTKRLAKISVTGNALAAICTFIMFVSPRIVNQEYVNWVHAYFANISVWFGNILANPHLIILFIIIVVLVLDSVNVIRKGNKAEKNDDDDDDLIEAEQNGGSNNG